MNIIKSKHFWKFLVSLLAMMLLGLSVAYGTNWYERQQFIEQTARQQADYAAYQAQYLNDTYGSTTPEGTLELFTDALKKNDIDLAVKYVFVDEKEKVKNDLEQARVKDGLADVISRLRFLKLAKKDESRAFFLVADTMEGSQYQILVKRSSNGIWKIIDL